MPEELPGNNSGDYLDPRGFLREAAESSAGKDIRTVVTIAGSEHTRNTRNASEVHVRFLHDPRHGEDFDRRHNALLVTRMLIEALLSQNPDRICEVRREIEGRGGFLMQYNGEGAHRLTKAYSTQMPEAGGWLMTETTGRMNGAPLHVMGADGQFYIPPDDTRLFDTDLPIPEFPADRPIEGDAALAAIQEDPRIAMLVGDIAAFREYQGRGLAAATEDAAYARVAQVINEQRVHKIQYALAAIASIKGLRDDAGNDLVPPMDPGMRNLRSVLLHTVRNRSTPGMILAQLRGRTTDVELPDGAPGKLLVDWYVTGQPIENAKLPGHITVSDETAADSL